MFLVPSLYINFNRCLIDSVTVLHSGRLHAQPEGRRAVLAGCPGRESKLAGGRVIIVPPGYHNPLPPTSTATLRYPRRAVHYLMDGPNEWPAEELIVYCRRERKEKRRRCRKLMFLATPSRVPAMQQSDGGCMKPYSGRTGRGWKDWVTVHHPIKLRNPLVISTRRISKWGTASWNIMEGKEESGGRGWVTAQEGSVMARGGYINVSLNYCAAYYMARVYDHAFVNTEPVIR